jgi:centromere protein C
VIAASPRKDSPTPRKKKSSSSKKESPTPKKSTKRAKYIVVDPEEEEEEDEDEAYPEETIDWAYYAKQSQIVPPGVRRSTRRKIPPLEFWRCEKVVYGVRNGTLGIVDVVKRPYTPPKKRKSKATKRS